MPGPLAQEFDCRSDFSDVAAARRFVRRALPDVDPLVSSDLQLVVSELMTNTIEHGSSSKAVIEVDLQPDAVLLTVTSHGSDGPMPPVDHWLLAPPDAEAGRGLGIVRQLVTDVDVEQHDDTVTVRVRLMLDRP